MKDCAIEFAQTVIGKNLSSRRNLAKQPVRDAEMVRVSSCTFLYRLDLEQEPKAKLWEYLKLWQSHLIDWRWLHSS